MLHRSFGYAIKKKGQGDIKPLISHLQFQGRFRRPDLTSVIDHFHQRRSRIASLSTTEYRLREVNFVADHLAGSGSVYLLHLHQAQSQLPCVSVYLDVAGRSCCSRTMPGWLAHMLVGTLSSPCWKCQVVPQRILST